MIHLIEKCTESHAVVLIQMLRGRTWSFIYLAPINGDGLRDERSDDSETEG